MTVRCSGMESRNENALSTGDISVDAFLTELMSIDSTSKYEGALTDELVKYFQSTGWYVHEQALTSDPRRRNLLVTRIPFKAPGPVYLMNTHLDTVPPFIAPQNDGTVVKGRGAGDAKGQLAAMIFAAQRIAKESPEKSQKLGLLLVVGEEVDHVGMIKANDLALEPDYLVVGEPTELKFARLQKGAFKVILKARGKAAHSGYPHLGESAINKLLDVLQDIRTYPWPNSERLGETTVNIGMISGGQALNALAASATASLFFRVTTSTADVYERLKEIVADRTEIDLSKISEPPLDIESCVVPFNTDLPYFVGANKLKGAYLFGGGNMENAHSEREFIPIDELKKTVDTHVELFNRIMNQK
ncbi:unnamed protein product [Enterobius vermicularis]|uniref:M20_dimer domain-containing protein n=1 Tax=Enterobius vermicularis TaxID=51028 RepID=A0A0N4V645_ENTVE|nr:unnamed protein product [Enterobius vermicularis]